MAHPPEHGHGPDAHGHDAHGHDAHGHDAHGHGGPAPEPETPPPPHVFAIARITSWLGILLCLGGAGLALLRMWQGAWTPFGLAAFASVYGFSIWLAARETLSKEYRATGSASQAG